jgi:hypothetical protein
MPEAWTVITIGDAIGAKRSFDPVTKTQDIQIRGIR